MTKNFCDNCEKELPFIGGVWLKLVEGYFAESNCLTSNPKFNKGFEFCSIDCAKKGVAKYLDELKPVKSY